MKRRVAANIRRVTRWRRDNSEAIKAMAARAEMSANQLSQYANNLKGTSVETLIRIATMADCTLDDLVSGVSFEYSRAAARRRYPAIPEDLIPVQIALDGLDEDSRRLVLETFLGGLGVRLAPSSESRAGTTLGASTTQERGQRQSAGDKRGREK